MKRLFPALGSAVGLCLLGVLLWDAWEERRLPHHEGRSVRSWFRQLYRGEFNNQDEPAALEAKAAFVAMGTNAHSFLLQQALKFPKDTPLRTNLHQLFRNLPPWLGGGSFVPHSQVHNSASFALRSLRPPAGWLVSQLASRLNDTNLVPSTQALFLLGCSRDSTPEQVHYLVRALALTSSPTDWRSTVAAQSLSWIGPAASNALPGILALTQTREHPALSAWMARLGPAAVAAVPALESALETGLAQTNKPGVVRAAIALECIAPGHAEARRILRGAAAAFSDGAGLPGRSRIPRGDLLHVLRGSVRSPNPFFLELVTPLAEAEAAAWSPNGSSFLACLALERMDPRRAAVLYRTRLDSAGAMVAAGSLLRIERTNAEAATVLMKSARKSGRDQSLALWWLGEGSSSLPGLTNLLAEFSDPNPAAAAMGMNARLALARLRYREARVARGLPADEWEWE